jgi:plastocyanin
MRYPVLLFSAFVYGLVAFAASPAAAAPAKGPSVSILAAAYGSAKVDVLAGDTVTWRNDSVRAHTVSATDGSFGSARLVASGTFTHRFPAPGVVGYYCQLHPFMRAEVDVHRLILDAPHDASAPGQPLAIAGRAALPAGTAVSIKAADGSVAGSATVANGRFSATVRPRASTSYTAVAGADVSPAVQVLVLDRKVQASAARASRHGFAVVRTRVIPASPGATVVLQLHLKQHFGWWPVKRVRLGRDSRARFVVRAAHKVRARVVLTAADGVTPLARSAVFKVRPG